MHTHREVERTFGPGPDTALPDLAVVPSIDSVAEVADVELDATYYDTPDLALLRAGVTLRRRTGGSDEGWHLKLPVLGAPGARDEVHTGLAAAGDPPPELAQLVTGWTRETRLSEVATIRTHRSTRHLLDEHGRVLAELADDVVTGTATSPGARPVSWREWEVELVTAGPGLLDDVERVLADHGVGRSAVQRKVALVLGDLRRPGADLPEPSRTDPARLVLHRWLAQQVREIEVLDPVARRLGEGGVHGIRKAGRRLRATLATYRPLLDRRCTDPVREELRWLGRSLGAARDDEVVQARIEHLLETLDPELVVGPVRDRLLHRREQRRVEDERQIGDLLGSRRYLDLRAALDALVAEPPWTDLADQPAADVLPVLVRKEWKRLRQRRRDAADPHEVRKGAKRLRHAYEMLEPVWGTEAETPRRVAQELTQVLGDRQDTVAARATLVELASAATAAGESAFTYGRLHAIEEQRERERLAEADEVWRALTKVRW